MCGTTGRPAERCTSICGIAARSATRVPGGRRAAAPGRVDIAERPEIVEEKSQVGDWEGDTGARHRGTVLSLVDRASRFTLLALLGGRTAGETGEAMRKRLGPYKEFVRTTDNGKEFAAHREVAGALETSFFFAQPYHSWERGLNEHTNGLVRQYKATGKLDPAEPRGGPAQQPAAQGAGLPDSRGSFQTGVDRGPTPLKRNLTRLPPPPPPCARCWTARLVRGGEPRRFVLRGRRTGQMACRPGETRRRPGGDFSLRRGRSPSVGLRPPCGERPRRPGILTHQLGGLILL